MSSPPHREHLSMPLRGRTRISSTGSGRNGESAMRTPSTTVPLTLRSWLNMLFIRRFLAVFFLVVKHPTQKALFLTPTTVQQRTRTHENSNSAKTCRSVRQSDRHNCPHLNHADARNLVNPQIRISFTCATTCSPNRALQPYGRCLPRSSTRYAEIW